MVEKIGFVGLGLMGHGMAKNIVEKGYPLAVLAHRITVKPELWMTDASATSVVHEVMSSVPTPATLESRGPGPVAAGAVLQPPTGPAVGA